MSSVWGMTSLVIIEFAPGTPPTTIQWILGKIKATREKGGAELKACLVTDRNSEVCKFSTALSCSLL